MIIFVFVLHLGIQARARGVRQLAGLPIRTAIDAYNLMDSYVYGFALQEKTLLSDIAQRPRQDGTTSPPRTPPSPAGSRTSLK